MLKKLFTLITGTALLILGIMFSAVVLGVLVVLGLAVWTYLRWKTRKFRKSVPQQTPEGEIIEGEAVIVEEFRVAGKDVLPYDPPRQ